MKKKNKIDVVIILSQFPNVSVSKLATFFMATFILEKLMKVWSLESQFQTLSSVRRNDVSL